MILAIITALVIVGGLSTAYHCGYMKAMRDVNRDIDKTFVEVLKWKLKEEKEKEQWKGRKEARCDAPTATGWTGTL